ncbi:hypothetical protein [Pedobacter miscanthi]|uniref:hypothetical protein n=1 Tax=Pedobacter miscanthi TaxID=2259170 RepID=UPI00292D6973|nr:hypothetical protein [Pedobacter miscanthi]
MKNIDETIRTYVKAWNQTYVKEIKAVFQEVCNSQVTFTDRVTPEITGIEQLAQLVIETHEKVPGMTFSVLTEPEYFDRLCYYSWEMSIPEKGLYIGRDFIEFDDKGLIKRIVGFLPKY